MSNKAEFPHMVGGNVSKEVRDQMTEACRRFGVKDGALVRLALTEFMPRYLAGGEAREFAAKVEEATKDNPGARVEIEKVLRRVERQKRGGRAA